MIAPPPQGYLFRETDGILWTYLGQDWVKMDPQNCYTLGRYNGLTVIYNPDRGYAHLHPLPDADTVEAYYNDDQFYATHSPPDWLEKERREYEAGLWDSYFRHLYEIIRTKEKPSPRILDYGCGAGWWLRWLTDNTWPHCLGVEPSRIARTHSEQKRIIRASPDEVPEEFNGFFDVVSAQLVLEHVSDPVEFLKSLSKWLAPGGKLLITVPNDFNPLQKKIDYWGFICPVHINYFTPDSLAHILREAGYNLVYEGATFPMEVFVLAGLNYIGNDKVGRRCHGLRLRLEKLFGWRIFKLYKRLYDRWGIGRELIFVAERTGK